MNTSVRPHSSIGWMAAAAGVALGAYAESVGTAWCRYGRIVIRWLSLGPLEADAERRARSQAMRPPAPSMERA